MAAKKGKAEESSDVAILDELIEEYRKNVKDNIVDHMKMGDFLKMVELKHKLEPAEADQKKFWAKLDRVRKGTLGKKTDEAIKTKAKKE